MVVSSVDMTATKLKLRMRCHYYIKHKSYVDVENTNQEDTGWGGAGWGGAGRVILWADCFGLIYIFWRKRFLPDSRQEATMVDERESDADKGRHH
jgi:hypothetical protein